MQCIEVCPAHAIAVEGGIVVIGGTCMGCARCRAACPTWALDTPEPLCIADRVGDDADGPIVIDCARVPRRRSPGGAIRVPCLGALRLPEHLQDQKRGIGVQQKNVVSKCTFCYHRVSQAPKGTTDIDPNDPKQREFAPACVVACLPNARYFGDIDDPTSKVRQLIAEKRGTRLLDQTGNRPQVYYLAGELAAIPETRSSRTTS